MAAGCCPLAVLPPEMVMDILDRLDFADLQSAVEAGGPFAAYPGWKLTRRRWTSEGLSQLAMKGDLAGVKFLLPSKDATSRDVDYSMCVAANHGHLPIVEHLYACGVPCNGAINSAKTLPVIKFLAATGERPSPYRVGLAIVNGDLATAQFFHSIGCRASDHQVTGLSEMVPLTLPMMRWLQSISARTWDCRAMEYACRLGEVETVRFLHSVGAPWGQGKQIARLKNHRDILILIREIETAGP